MSSASQLVFGSVQGSGFLFAPPAVPDLSNAIIEDGPVVYWQLYNGSNSSTTESDLSGNGYDSELGNSIYTAVSPIRDGLATGAGSFPKAGTDTVYRDTSNSPDIPDFTESKTWTLEIVTQVATPLDLGAIGVLWGDLGNNQDALRCLLYFDDRGVNGQLRGLCNVNGTDYVVSYNLPEGTSTMHVVLVRDTTELRLYVNGVLASTRTGLPDLITTLNRDPNYPKISTNDNATTYRQTFIACDAAGYDYALSEERIVHHYNVSGLGGWTPQNLYTVPGTKGVWVNPSESSSIRNASNNPAAIGERAKELVNLGFDDSSSPLALDSGSGAFLRQGSNSRYLEFDEVSSVYRLDTLSANDSYDIFVAAAIVPRGNTDTGVISQVRYPTSQGSGDGQFLLLSADGATVSGNGRSDPSNGYISPSGLSVTPGEGSIAFLKIDGAADTVTLEVDGNESSIGGATLTPTGDIRVELGGRNNITPDLFSNSDLYELVIVLGRIPSSEEQAELTNYLSRHF